MKYQVNFKSKIIIIQETLNDVDFNIFIVVYKSCEFDLANNYVSCDKPL